MGEPRRETGGVRGPFRGPADKRSDVPRGHDRRGGEPWASRGANLGECGGHFEAPQTNGRTCLAGMTAEAASHGRAEARSWGSAGAISRPPQLKWGVV